MSGDLFDSVLSPRELAWPDFQPHEAVRRIVQARDSERRLALLAETVPAAWRDLVLHFVVVQLAGRLFDALPDQRAMLAETIPRDWIAEVRAHFRRYQEQARARAAREARQRAAA